MSRLARWTPNAAARRKKLCLTADRDPESCQHHEIEGEGYAVRRSVVASKGFPSGSVKCDLLSGDLNASNRWILLEPCPDLQMATCRFYRASSAGYLYPLLGSSHTYVESLHPEVEVLYDFVKASYALHSEYQNIF